MTPDKLDNILKNVENYDLELKTAQGDFNVKKLHDYCAAISNEDGGHLLFGVNDARQVVGSKAFSMGWNKLAHQLTEHLDIRIKVYEVMHNLGRVLAFEIPRHAVGKPTKVVGGSGKYTYPIRDGESLVEMGQQTLQDIFAERVEDWSAQIAKEATMEDLEEGALGQYRAMWAKYTESPRKLEMPYREVLESVGLMDGEGITNAALLLFAKEASLRRYIPDAEIIFEWRNQRTDIAYGERQNWRDGFIGIRDAIWASINARNTVFRLQEGFVQRDVYAYDEDSIREAVVNAFVHRDYTITGHSIRILLNPENFYIENPGRLMPGVTLENIIDKTVWRNRLLAESLEKVNIMERSSQGINTIFRRAIESGKGAPSIAITNDPSVQLMIPAKLVDQKFVRFLERVVNEKGETLSDKEIIELEMIRMGKKNSRLEFKDKFLKLGLIEKQGRGRGSRYILAHKYYVDAGDVGRHTRLAGLSRAVKVQLVLEHIRKNGSIRNEEVQTAMPEMDTRAASRLLVSMRDAGMIKHSGSRKDGQWIGNKEVIKGNKKGINIESTSVD